MKTLKYSNNFWVGGWLRDKKGEREESNKKFHTNLHEDSARVPQNAHNSLTIMSLWGQSVEINFYKSVIKNWQFNFSSWLTGYSNFHTIILISVLHLSKILTWLSSFKSRYFKILNVCFGLRILSLVNKNNKIQ